MSPHGVYRPHCFKIKMYLFNSPALRNKAYIAVLVCVCRGLYNAELWVSPSTANNLYSDNEWPLVVITPYNPLQTCKHFATEIQHQLRFRYSYSICFIHGCVFREMASMTQYNECLGLDALQQSDESASRTIYKDFGVRNGYLRHTTSI